MYYDLLPIERRIAELKTHVCRLREMDRDPQVRDRRLSTLLKELIELSALRVICLEEPRSLAY